MRVNDLAGSCAFRQPPTCAAPMRATYHPSMLGVMDGVSGALPPDHQGHPPAFLCCLSIHLRSGLQFGTFRMSGVRRQLHAWPGTALLVSPELSLCSLSRYMRWKQSQGYAQRCCVLSRANRHEFTRIYSEFRARRRYGVSGASPYLNSTTQCNAPHPHLTVLAPQPLPRGLRRAKVM